AKEWQRQRAAKSSAKNVFVKARLLRRIVGAISRDAVDGFFRARQRVKDLRKVQPLHGAVVSVVTALGDDVENTAAGASELSAEQGGLDRYFRDCIFVVDLVRR